MEIKLIRTTFTDLSTIGEMLIDGKHFCWTLELPWGDGANAHDKNCILPGTYDLLVNHSPHLGYDTPELQNVPNRDNIRIHIANWPKDILGCIGIGLSKGTDYIGQSAAAFKQFMPLVLGALKEGTVSITIS